MRANPSVRVLVYTSSSSVVHNNLTDLVRVTEDMAKCYLPEHTEFYTYTKARAEDMVLEANRTHGLLTTVVRGVALFGEGDQTTIPQMVASARSFRSKIQVRALIPPAHPTPILLIGGLRLELVGLHLSW